MLISLQFPPSSMLREQVVADMLGVSRTPVREAIQRLAQEGWLVIGDKKRVQVTPVTISDINELFQLRLILEPYAALETLKNGKPRILAAALDSVLNEMEQVRNDSVVFVQLDMKFHSQMMEKADNIRLNRFWRTLHEESSRCALMTLANNYDREARVIEEHAAIVNAFWNKDTELIQNMVKNHLIQSRNACVANMDEHDEKDVWNF